MKAARCRNSIVTAIWWPEAAGKAYRWNRKEITEYERNYTLGSIQGNGRTTKPPL